MSTPADFASMAEASLLAAKTARAAGNHRTAAALASSARTHARLCLAAADLKRAPDANAVQRAEKAAAEAEDVTGWTPPGWRPGRHHPGG